MPVIHLNAIMASLKNKLVFTGSHLRFSKHWSHMIIFLSATLHVSFLSLVKMNSTIWPAPNVSLSIA